MVSLDRNWAVRVESRKGLENTQVLQPCTSLCEYIINKRKQFAMDQRVALEKRTGEQILQGE